MLIKYFLSLFVLLWSGLSQFQTLQHRTASNAIFNAETANPEHQEHLISKHLDSYFLFPGSLGNQIANHYFNETSNEEETDESVSLKKQKNNNHFLAPWFKFHYRCIDYLLLKRRLNSDNRFYSHLISPNLYIKFQVFRL
ncbi:hypothetical protein MQE36_02505 [Zhouia spongiae]|uniref:Uncharacterized protein n=1 Tax=Zhouia spongiae TaxID=2202721 RepID=A0ABY3YN18_9FLAO|nr:hypothetical protein [Zhouia spongiae]UNY99225.1 hypothetical protein MQE36_02505 [Zhouia spongiae]